MKRLSALLLTLFLSACMPNQVVTPPITPTAQVVVDNSKLGASFSLSVNKIIFFVGLDSASSIVINLTGNSLKVNPSAPCYGDTNKLTCVWEKIDANKTLTLPFFGLVTDSKIEFDRSTKQRVFLNVLRI
jgi:hypothetical protein